MKSPIINIDKMREHIDKLSCKHRDVKKHHDCHYWKMLTEDTGSVSILPDGSVKETAIDPDREIPELCDLSFKRCPYCGEKL